MASAYKKAPFFSEIYPLLEELYLKSYDRFVDMSFEHLLFWLELLNLKTRVIKSSELDISSKKSDLVFDICKNMNADTYISGALGKDYLDVKKFEDEHIHVEFQNYVYSEYSQLYGDFIPNLGIIDFVMNEKDYSVI